MEVSGLSGELHPQRKSPQYPLDRRLGWGQIRSERGGEEKKSLPLLEFENANILSQERGFPV